MRPTQILGTIGIAILLTATHATVGIGQTPPPTSDVDVPVAEAQSSILELAPSSRLHWVRTWRMAPFSSAEVRAVLVTIALNDECEVIRYEAVTALHSMLAEDAARASGRVPMQTVCCTKPRGILGRLFSRVFGLSPRSRRVIVQTAMPAQIENEEASQSTCCSIATRDALQKIAFGGESSMNDAEPSQRVRDAALAALSLCERLGTCPIDAVPAVPPGPTQPHPKHQHNLGPGLDIEEPPPGSGGFEPLALAR